MPRSPEVCGLGPLCLTELLALWGLLLLLLALFSEITKNHDGLLERDMHRHPFPFLAGEDTPQTTLSHP